MSTPAVHPTPAAGPAPQAPPPHPHRQALDDLVAMGTDIARRLHAQAHASQPTPETLVTTAAAFDRIARAVRRCIALARLLDQPTPDPAQHRTAARARIIREVEDRIERNVTALGERPADLHGELRTRLDAPDLDDDITSRPVADIIAEICRDLGLAAPPGIQPWKRRTPADLHHLRTRAATPTAPLPAPGIRGRWPPPT